MTREFENMLYLFGCGATGKDVRKQYCENLSKIREFAIKQGIWDVIYSGVRKKIEGGEISIPAEIYMHLENSFMANIALNLQRVEFNLQTIRKLDKEGIRCCVLKGITVAVLYAVPETRVSGDMDILIDEKDEERVKEILSKLDYVCEERSKHDHHMKAYHKTGGLLEVHIDLYSIPTKEIVFGGEISYNEEYVLMDNGVYTLSPNDTVVYLTAHLIKHLVNDAAGIRQMMDLLLYMKANEQRINWDKYNQKMKQLGYDNLIAVIKGIGIRFFDMEFDNAITEGNGMEELLMDCEIGGIFAVEENNRKRFYEIYMQIRSGKNNFQHSLYRLTKSEQNVSKILFPKYSVMRKKFVYVNKLPALLPVGWVHRIIKLILKHFGFIKKIDENSSMVQRRMEMVQKLGMIKNGENK